MPNIPMSTDCRKYSGSPCISRDGGIIQASYTRFILAAMCGILGIFSPSGLRPLTDAFANALNRLNLRGPDDSGIWRDEYVQLGHRRLSIVDLSAAGHQPMKSFDGRYAIVFNGEIYNHRELRK